MLDLNITREITKIVFSLSIEMFFHYFPTPGAILHHCHFTSAPPMLIQSSSASSIALFLKTADDVIAMAK